MLLPAGHRQAVLRRGIAIDEAPAVAPGVHRVDAFERSDERAALEQGHRLGVHRVACALAPRVRPPPPADRRADQDANEHEPAQDHGVTPRVGVTSADARMRE
jgi:hypothetical protein